LFSRKKADEFSSRQVGEIISRFEHKGFVLKGLKLFQTPEELAQNHYFELKEKPFYPKLVKYIISGPVVCMVCLVLGPLAFVITEWLVTCLY
jgi:nucleoside-diphosphate kinase